MQLQTSLRLSTFEQITRALSLGNRLLAVLIDPDKFDEQNTASFLHNLPDRVTHIFVGGSTDANQRTDAVVRAIKATSSLPVVLFPGDHSQITEAADSLLFLCLISGRNPEYLIGQHIKAVARLRNSALEVIPCGYILIDGGKESAVQKISSTLPIPQAEKEKIINTALAGQLSGKKLIYLEAGSGAAYPVSSEIIQQVKAAINIPLIVGGGIRTQQQLTKAYEAGADVVVIGTAFETGVFE